MFGNDDRISFNPMGLGIYEVFSCITSAGYDVSEGYMECKKKGEITVELSTGKMVLVFSKNGIRIKGSKNLVVDFSETKNDTTILLKIGIEIGKRCR